MLKDITILTMFLSSSSTVLPEITLDTLESHGVFSQEVGMCKIVVEQLDYLDISNHSPIFFVGFWKYFARNAGLSYDEFIDSCKTKLKDSKHYSELIKEFKQK